MTVLFSFSRPTCALRPDFQRPLDDERFIYPPLPWSRKDPSIIPRTTGPSYRLSCAISALTPATTSNQTRSTLKKDVIAPKVPPPQELRIHLRSGALLLNFLNFEPREEVNGVCVWKIVSIECCARRPSIVKRGCLHPWWCRHRQTF